MRRLSIRDILLLITGILTLMIVLLAARDMVANWRILSGVRALRSASALSDRLFDATERLSFERDIALSMLDTRDPDTAADLRPRLIEARRAADGALRSGMGALDRYDFPELAALRGRIRIHFAAIQELRRQVDQAARPGGGARRKGELAERWSREVTSLIVETQTLWVGFIGHFTGIDPIVTQQLWYKHFLRTITDYAGRERSLIGHLIVTNADPSPAEAAQLLRGQGIAEESWQMAAILAAQGKLFPAIAPAYRDAQSQYSTMHDMMRDMFYAPGARHGAVYPIGIELWFELSNQASDSLGALRGASIRQTQTYLDGLAGTAERQIALQAGLFALSLFLSAYSFRVVLLRVVNPINAMIDALVRTSRGESVSLVLPQNRGDEIGKLAGVLDVIRGALDEVRRTADQLDRSESHLRAVVDHAVDGLITFDATGTIRSVNQACERIFGHDAEAMTGRNIRLLLCESGAGADDDAGQPAFSAAGEFQVMAATGRELTGRRKDGTLFPVELSVSSFLSGDGFYLLGIVRDITARKQAEQALICHTEALERSNKELDDFAYIASHDLKEPLRGIHNHSRFLLEDNAATLDKESVGRLDRLVFLSQRMERLVNDLLYFSRLGRQDLAVQPTDLGAVVADIESTLEHFLEERGARIVLAGPLPRVTCDRTRVTELLRNLITNAVKYNDKTDKLVEIGHLESRPNRAGAMLRDVFFVRDNGVGIAPEFHDDIFRIFKRLQASKQPEDGTGVGLTFVKKIVERHGGEIWLDSEPGKGTTFYFTLEASHHDRAHQPKEAA